jgi:SAM-dependent methyltransferase
MNSLIGDNHEQSWRRYGRDDPYFGVLTEERFRSANMDAATREEFFATGREHVGRILSVIRRHVTSDMGAAKALDFGCGVGRLLLPLARNFREVCGVDISEDYLAETRANAAREGVSNLKLVVKLEQLAGEKGSYDLLHSCIVFNHIPLAAGRVLLEQMADLTRDGGVLAIQMLHRRHASPSRRLLTWVRRQFSPLNWLSNWIRRRPVFEPVMQANEYPLDVVVPLLRERGGRDFHLEFSRAFGDSYIFLFCRIDRAAG